VKVSVGSRENGCAYYDAPVTTKVIHLHTDGKRQLNTCCIQYKGKNMNRFHTSSKQLQMLSKQRKGTGNKGNFFTYTYNVKCKVPVLKYH